MKRNPRITDPTVRWGLRTWHFLILIGAFLAGAAARDPGFLITGFFCGAALMGSLIFKLWKPDDVIVYIRRKKKAGEA